MCVCLEACCCYDSSLCLMRWDISLSLLSFFPILLSENGSSSKDVAEYALFSWWIFILLNSVQGQVGGMGEMVCGLLLQGSILTTLPAVAPLSYFHSFFSLWFSCDLLGHMWGMELALPKRTFPYLSRYCWLHNVWLIWFASYSSNDFLNHLQYNI